MLRGEHVRNVIHKDSLQRSPRHAAEAVEHGSERCTAACSRGRSTG